MMSLSKLATLIVKISGTGYPAEFVTPDGKRWEIERVVSTQTMDGVSDKYLTTVSLVPAQDTKS